MQAEVTRLTDDARGAKEHDRYFRRGVMNVLDFAEKVRCEIAE